MSASLEPKPPPHGAVGDLDIGVVYPTHVGGFSRRLGVRTGNGESCRAANYDSELARRLRGCLRRLAQDLVVDRERDPPGNSGESRRGKEQPSRKGRGKN